MSRLAIDSIVFRVTYKVSAIGRGSTGMNGQHEELPADFLAVRRLPRCRPSKSCNIQSLYRTYLLDWSLGPDRSAVTRRADRMAATSRLVHSGDSRRRGLVTAELTVGGGNL